MINTRDLAKEFNIEHIRVTTAMNPDNILFYRDWAGQEYEGYTLDFTVNGEPMITDEEAEHFREWFPKFLKLRTGRTHNVNKAS